MTTQQHIIPPLLHRAAAKALPVFMMTKPLAERIMRNTTHICNHGILKFIRRKSERRRMRIADKAFSSYGTKQAAAMLMEKTLCRHSQQALAQRIDNSYDAKMLLISKSVKDETAVNTLLDRIDNVNDALVLLISRQIGQDFADIILATKIESSVDACTALSRSEGLAKTVQKLLAERITESRHAKSALLSGNVISYATQVLLARKIITQEDAKELLFSGKIMDGSFFGIDEPPSPQSILAGMIKDKRDAANLIESDAITCIFALNHLTSIVHPMLTDIWAREIREKGGIDPKWLIGKTPRVREKEKGDKKNYGPN